MSHAEGAETRRWLLPCADKCLPMRDVDVSRTEDAEGAEIVVGCRAPMNVCLYEMLYVSRGDTEMVVGCRAPINVCLCEMLYVSRGGRRDAEILGAMEYYRAPWNDAATVWR